MTSDWVHSGLNATALAESCARLGRLLSNRAVLDRAVRTLSAVGAGAGGGSGGDVRARGFDPQKPALAKAGVKAITEELCGHSFSASSISAMNEGLDASLRNLPVAAWPKPSPI